MSRTTKAFFGLTVLVAGLSFWAFVTKSDQPPRIPSTAEIDTAPLPMAPTTALSKQQPIDTTVTDAEVGTGTLLLSDPESAARSAAAALVALDEHRMVSDETATAMTVGVAAVGSRDALVSQAVRQTRSLRKQLGAGITLMAQPLRARTVSITPTTAEIDVWWVKVVTSPEHPTAGDIWGTTRVSLTWEADVWKVSNEASRLGPWPTHATDRVTHASGASFAAQLDGFTQVGGP
jgi:hypothetical protein